MGWSPTRGWRGFGAVAALACGSWLAIAAPIALAAPGDLDPSFGSAGKVTLNFGGTDRATHAAITPDGRIVVIGSTDATGGGDYAVARLKADGSPDPTFDFGGQETFGTQPGVNDIGGGVVVLPDERIVITGQGNTTRDFVTKRLNADGTLDTSFANAGTSVVDFGTSDDIPNQMVRQADGKLVLVGATGSAGHHDFAVARLNADGSLDTSFGTGGKQTIDFGGDDIANAAAVQSDGKIVLAGQGDPDSEMAIARLNSNGTMDSTFGTGGEATIDFGGASSVNALALESDGKLVLAGATAAVGGGDFAIARLNPNGALDPTFNATGKQTLGYGAPDESALGVVVQQNGRIVVRGNGDVNHDVVATRLNSDGAVDTTFGTGGTSKVDYGGYEYDGDLALQPDGKLVLVGSTNVHDGGDMAVARLQGDPVSTGTGGGGGSGGGTIGGAGSAPQDPTLALSVRPTTPIATVLTTFVFTVKQYGSRRFRATVSFDGKRRSTNAVGQAKFRVSLDLHPYVAGATFTGAPGATVEIIPRYVPRLVVHVFPGRPIVGRPTTLQVFVTLKGKPAYRARITIGDQTRRTDRNGSTGFRVTLLDHPYVLRATAGGALGASFTVRPIRFPL